MLFHGSIDRLEFEMRERVGLAPFPLLEVTGTNERSTGGVAPFPLLEVIGTNERSTGGVLASKLRLL